MEDGPGYGGLLSKVTVSKGRGELQMSSVPVRSDLRLHQIIWAAVSLKEDTQPG